MTEYLTAPIAEGSRPGLTVPGRLLSDEHLPWHFSVLGFNTPDYVTPGWVGESFYLDTWPHGLAWCGGLNSEWGIDILMAKGTWTIEIPYDKRSDYPIVQHKIDGVNLGATVDRYAADTAQGKASYTGIVVATTGLHRVSSTAVSKNAASTNYTNVYSGVYGTRTA